MSERLRRIRHYVLDMDGTVYLGRRVFPWTRPFIELLGRLQIGHSFITNNNSHGPEEYANRLRGMGIPVELERIYTSTMATIEYLREQEPPPSSLFVLGSESLRSEFASAGFKDCGDSANDAPDAVVVGFDTSLRYERLCRAAYWIAKGKPFLATHPDRICPTEEEVVLPDCGSLCACLTHAIGREPDVVLGKPHKRMVTGALHRWGIQPGDAAVVGDRLYTDMRMARDCGALAILVLSGETTRAEAEAARGSVDLIVRDLGELAEHIHSTPPPPPPRVAPIAPPTRPRVASIAKEHPSNPAKSALSCPLDRSVHR